MNTENLKPRPFKWEGNPTLPCHAELIGPTSKEAKETWLLLHGYGERASTMVRRFAPLFARLPHIQFIIPNGFFPIPRLTEDGIKEAYAWYFYDHSTRTTLIPPETGVVLIQELLKKIQAENQPLRIIGFSQGGFLAPFIARKITQVVHTIGMSCNHPKEFYPEKVNWKVDAIHGEKDGIILHHEAKKAYQELRDRGIKGSFHTLPDLGHDVDQEVLSVILKLTE